VDISKPVNPNSTNHDESPCDVVMRIYIFQLSLENKLESLLNIFIL